MKIPLPLLPVCTNRQARKKTWAQGAGHRLLIDIGWNTKLKAVDSQATRYPSLSMLAVSTILITVM